MGEAVPFTAGSQRPFEWSFILTDPVEPEDLLGVTSEW